jgi:hypothetical protein
LIQSLASLRASRRIGTFVRQYSKGVVDERVHPVDRHPYPVEVG